MSFIKDNGGMLAVVAVAVAVLAAYGDWRVGVKVEDALAEHGFATTDRINEIEKDIEDQKEVHNDDRDRMDGKIERIVDILLEE